MNTHLSNYSDGTKLQSEDVHSQVIDILSCPQPYQQQIGYFEIRRKALELVLFRNTKDGTPASIITTLSEAFGIEGFTISIS